MADIAIPQTALTAVPAEAIAGMIANLGVGYSESVVVEAAVDAGMGVIIGATAQRRAPLNVDYAKNPAATGDPAKLQGITVYDPLRVTPAGATKRYAANDVVRIVRRGLIWVQINQNVTNGAPAFLVYTGADLGKFRLDTGSTTAEAAPTCVFRATTTAALGIGLLEINLT